MTNRPMVRIHNVETDEITDREMDDFEFAQYQADLKLAEEKAKEQIEREAAKAALLEKLGITEDEAKLLLS